MSNPLSQAPSPLSIERDYRTLLIHLANPWPARRQLQEIREFLLQVLPDCKLYESYVLEVVQRMPEIAGRLNVRGIDPANIRPLYDALKELIIKLPSLSTLGGISPSMQKLREILVTLYGYVGETPPGNEFANAGSPPSRETTETEQNENVFIPVVERNPADISGKFPEAGYLRRISAEITGTSSQDSDVFQTQVLVLGEDGGLTTKLILPVLAARALLKKSHPHASETYFHGIVKFDEVNAYHEGSSAGAAIAAILYCTLLKKVGARERFTLNKDTTLTGGIREDGEVLPVDAKALATKTEAVFFSDVRCFVVPNSQQALAQQIVDRLRERYPKRQLEILGIRFLHELFYDRRLSTEIRTGIVEDTLRKLWARKLPIAAALVITCLVLIVARTTIPVADDNPVGADFAGGKMLIKNDHGETLEEVEVGTNVIEQTAVGNAIPDADKICKFFDVNADGQNDYIFLRENEQHPDQPPALVCRDLWKKMGRWQLTFPEQHSFPNNPIDNTQLLTIKDFIVGRFDPSGTPKVFAIANHAFFPGELFEVNALDGKILGTFLHTGHFTSLGATELGGGNVQDIIVAGWNNSFSAVSLAVFDPRFISGCSPFSAAFAPSDAVPGSEMYYMLIPSSPVQQPLKRNEIYNGPTGFDLKDSNATIALSVTDLSVNMPDSKEILKGNVTLSFDKTMKLTTVNTSPEWNLAAATLLREHKIADIPSPKYLNEFFKRELKYWNGYHWQTTPTMNVRYLDILEKSHPN